MSSKHISCHADGEVNNAASVSRLLSVPERDLWCLLKRLQCRWWFFLAWFTQHSNRGRTASVWAYVGFPLADRIMPPALAVLCWSVLAGVHFLGVLLTRATPRNRVISMSFDISSSAVLLRCCQGVVFVLLHIVLLTEHPCVCVWESPEHAWFSSLFVLPSLTPLQQAVVFNGERWDFKRAEKLEVLTNKCHWSLFLDFYSLWVVTQSEHARREVRGLFIYLFLFLDV